MNLENNILENENSLESLNDYLAFESENDKLDFETEMLNLDIVNLIQLTMEDIGLTKTDLAKLLNINKSHITQIFSADKMLNLKLLAKIQRVLEIKFNFSVTSKYDGTRIHSIEDYRKKYENYHNKIIENDQDCVIYDIRFSNKEKIA